MNAYDPWKIASAIPAVASVIPRSLMMVGRSGDTRNRPVWRIAHPSDTMTSIRRAYPVISPDESDTLSTRQSRITWVAIRGGTLCGGVIAASATRAATPDSRLDRV
jgi:hypothetical protein